MLKSGLVLTVTWSPGAASRAASVEAASVEAASVEAASMEDASVEAASVDAASVEAASMEAASMEAASVEAASVDSLLACALKKAVRLGHRCLARLVAVAGECKKFCRVLHSAAASHLPHHYTAQ